MDRIVRECLERIKDGITENIRTTGRWASGKTAESMRIEETDGTGGRLVGRAFFHGLETGRPQGKTPRNFTDIIEQWMKDKGIQPSNGNYRSAAYLIARKIRIFGTVLYREGGANDVYTPVIDAEIERLRDAVAIEIKERIINSLKLK